MAYNAGNAFITVSPDMSKFQDEVKAKFAKSGDDAGKAFGDAFQDRVKVAFANLPNANITADADTAKAKAELDDAAKNRTAKITVSVDKDALKSLALPAAGIAGAAALGPSAVGLGLGVAGLGVAFGAAAAGALSFGAVAKGMFGDVTTAQKKLTTAQQEYAKATTGAERTKALADEKAALDGLTPSERQLTTELTALQAAWKSVDQAEQPVVGAALAPWLATATQGVGLLKPVIGDASEAIGILGENAQAAFTAPYWGTFFSTLGNTGRLAIENFGDAAGHVGDGLAHLFTTFAPDIDKLPPLVDKAASAFDNWAKSVTAGGLESFFKTTFSPANVATLKADLGNVATIVENIAKAGASLSPTAFSGLSNLLAVAAKLSPGQIEALAALYAGGKAVGGAGNLAKLLTGGASLSLPTIGKKTATSDAEKAAEKGGGKLLPLALPAAAGLAVADGILHLPGVNSTSKALAANPKDQSPSVPVLGKLPQSFETPFNMPGPNDPRSANNWLTSWAPYERIFTTDLPKAWSISYEAFQVEFAGPMTAWFTNSLPHFFTAGIPMGWDTAYQGFENGFGSPVAAWFTNSLPHFFTAGIPANVWSPAYEGFERDIGSPIAAWFTNSLPHFFESGGTLAAGWGRDIGNGLVSGWNATEGAVTGAFGAAEHWVTGEFTGAVSWLNSAGNSAATGLVRAWDATEANVTADFGRAKTWATGALSSSASWLTSAGNQAGSGLVHGWDATEANVTADFGKAKSWVTGAFNGAESWLTAAGKAVMGGFLGSLEGGFTDVQNFVTSIAGWIAAHKGPVSADYLLLQPAGQAIMGGFGDALSASFASHVQPVIAGVAPAIASLSGIASAQSLGALSALNIPSIGSPARLPGVSSPLSGGQLQLQLSYAGTGNQLTDALIGALRVDVQANAGGDVQAHIGQGPVRVQ